MKDREVKTMPMTSKSIPDKPTEAIKPERPKRTVHDIIRQSGAKTSLYKNDNDDPVGVRLDSIAPVGRKAIEWVWLKKDQEAELPCADVKEAHKLTLMSNRKE